MPYITEIVNDGELNTALANFNTVCIANAAALGLVPADLTEIAAAATGFNTNLNTATAAKATANSAVEAKDLQKATSRGVVAKWAKVFRAKTTVSDALLNQLMLPPHKTPGSFTAPTTPTDLVATANGDGVIALRWKRNGNIASTTFTVEYRMSASDPWVILGTTTKVSFGYESAPGQYIAFRVSASRRGVSSPASTPVVLWDTEQGQTLQLAA
ncbi:MAG: hypothetical protein HONBIEJF_00551 [Fimbriimonadaceae bacterium]|nr:hypothetical protein [Fimbriimonadaceae bacterium]